MADFQKNKNAEILKNSFFYCKRITYCRSKDLKITDIFICVNSNCGQSGEIDGYYRFKKKS